MAEETETEEEIPETEMKTWKEDKEEDDEDGPAMMIMIEDMTDLEEEIMRNSMTGTTEDVITDREEIEEMTNASQSKSN
ncbi:MAG: hypothetical protein AAFN94_18845 [Pseudomonadota bacterium]